jgi:hypothetical protein
VQIAERKLAELRDKLAGISAEFDRWLAEAGERRPLRKHHSQISRLTAQLGGLVERVGQDLDAALGDRDGVLDDSRALQMRILEVHRIWDFYRSKLNLRYIEWFRPYLGTVDEFAWACYALADAHGRRPDASAPAAKTAPLVFLSGEFSPFLHARQSPFDVEEVADAPDTLGFLQIVSALPVPVIGLPWYQLTHLPDAVLVAHEIGHDVERDRRMAGTALEHVRAVGNALPAERRAAWIAWLPEVVADLYGVLAGGPAFVAALVDLLAVDPAEVAAEPVGPPWRPHPPAAVRVAVTTAALEHTGFAAEADAQRRAWAEAYPAVPTDPTAPLAADVPHVVGALLTRPFPQLGDQALPAVVMFTAAQQKAASAAADAVLDGQRPATGDIRCLVAAARLAFERKPDEYQRAQPPRKSPQQLILERAAEVIDDRPRGEDRAQPDPAEDRKAGADLLALIERLDPRPARTARATEGERR